MALSMAERKAVTRKMAERYIKASKTEKGRLLDELCALTGWTRRHARRALAEAGREAPASCRRPRARTYDAEVFEPLRKVWAVLGGPAGKRLAPFMEEIVVSLERAGEISLEPAVRHKLLRISAATIDRMLAPERDRLKVKGRSGTKPGSLLIKTDPHQDVRRVGRCSSGLLRGRPRRPRRRRPSR